MMKNLLFVLLCCCSSMLAQPQLPAIVPEPLVVKTGSKGRFIIDDKTRILAPQASGRKAADYLQVYIKKYYGTALQTGNGKKPSRVIRFEVAELPGQPAGAYTLSVDRDGVRIRAAEETGLFYGAQTLIQLLPLSGRMEEGIPYLTVEDAPRFEYRGMHLDVGRHMFPVEFIKKYIDFLALHKMNYFHWHLTEDQGWRIEIKKHPRLTEIGGWRNGTAIGHRPPRGVDNIRYGGFYTQDEVREVVAYAAERCITVIPEIEMPGHALSILAAYPHLGCGDQPGPYEVARTWGIFEDVLCAGKEEVFSLLEDVLTEVMELFPSQYIHIGGDECPKTRWKSCPHCQRRIRENRLVDEFALQSWFIKRIEKFVNSKGRYIIGWNEIIEGGLAPNAVLMNWQGWKGADLEAVHTGNKVIMANSTATYMNKRPSVKEDSIGTRGKLLFLDSVYLFEPVSAHIPADKASYIWGGQGNIWTEYIRRPEEIEYLLFPRLSALSEVLWTAREKKDWERFQTRLPDLYRRYDLWGVHYELHYFTDRGIDPRQFNLRRAVPQLNVE